MGSSKPCFLLLITSAKIIEEMSDDKLNLQALKIINAHNARNLLSTVLFQFILSNDV